VAAAIADRALTSGMKHTAEWMFRRIATSMSAEDRRGGKGLGAVALSF
jgi:hypothetical protein